MPMADMLSIDLLIFVSLPRFLQCERKGGGKLYKNHVIKSYVSLLLSENFKCVNGSILVFHL